MKNYTTMRHAFSAIIAICVSSILILNSCSSEQKPTTQNSKSNNGFQIPALLTRTGELSQAIDWSKTQEAVNKVTQKISQQPNDFASYIKLSEIYINEARVTGEHGYYYPSILNMLDYVLSNQLNDEIKFKALSLKSSVYLSLHQFAKANETALEAVKINPDNAQIYGALVDANVELGNYDEAVKMAETMMNKRPDLLSYSRASYLREIHGDPKGAIEAMQMAVESGFPGYENEAWTRNTLAHIYETYGDLQSAEREYQTTLAERPGYPFAVAGLASVELKKGNFKEAEEKLNQAINIIPEVSFYVQLAELYNQTGREAEAQNTLKTILEMMADDEAKGHTMALEYAKVYMNVAGNLEKALEYAQKEYDVRPTNIDVNKALAEIYYKMGNQTEAEKHLAMAFITHSKNPELLEVAGLINIRGGHQKEGEMLVKQAHEANPYLSPIHFNTQTLAMANSH